MSRTITENYEVYTFEEASKELRDKIRQRFAYDVSHFDVELEEYVDTLKAFGKYIRRQVDYSISCVPDRNEYIRLKPYGHYDYEERDLKQDLKDFVNEKDVCPLTGVHTDEVLRDAIKASNYNLEYAFQSYLDAIHDAYEYTLTDEYLLEMCEANDYEFKENGEIK